MMKPIPWTTVALAATVLATAGWAGGCSKQGATRVIGSTSIQPFAEMLSEEFNAANPDLHVEVQGGGSTAGVQAVAEGIADIGMVSRGLTDEERQEYEPIIIAQDGISVVVNPDNPIGDLTIAQIRDVFAGRITNWKELGGPDRNINSVTREEGSGTREAFQTLAMGESRISDQALTQESNGSVKELVRSDPWSIGYMSMGLVGRDLKALSIGGVPPTPAHVIDKSYPLVRPFLFITRKGAALSDGARRFVDFVMFDRGGAVLEKEGLIAPRQAKETK